MFCLPQTVLEDVLGQGGMPILPPLPRARAGARAAVTDSAEITSAEECGPATVTRLDHWETVQAAAFPHSATKSTLAA